MDELVEGCLLPETLNSRYDDLRAVRVKPIDSEAAFARLKAKTEAERHRSE